MRKVGRGVVTSADKKKLKSISVVAVLSGVGVPPACVFLSFVPPSVVLLHVPIIPRTHTHIPNHLPLSSSLPTVTTRLYITHTSLVPSLPPPSLPPSLPPLLPSPSHNDVGPLPPRCGTQSKAINRVQGPPPPLPPSRAGNRVLEARAMVILVQMGQRTYLAACGT